MQTFDIQSLSSQHQSQEAVVRLEKRKRAEKRLHVAGIVAISFAILALFFLLFSVLSKSLGNFTKHTISTNISLDQSVIDPENTGDDSVIRRANYNSLLLRALLAEFPFMDTRRGKRELSALISGEAAFELSDMVRENNELIGQTVAFEALASDTADLYYKGHYGRPEVLLTSDDEPIRLYGRDLDQRDSLVTIRSESEIFAEALKLAKEIQIREAERLQRRADRQSQGVRYLEHQLSLVGEDALGEDQRREAQEQLSVYIVERDRLTAAAQDLRTRAEAVGGTATLNASKFSLFVHLDNGVIKADEISPAALKGHVIIPLAHAEKSETRTWEIQIFEQPEATRKLNDTQVLLLEQMDEIDLMNVSFNTRYFTASDSREPELAGIWGGVVGSFLTMIVTMLLAVPIGVLSSIYLEEFAPKNRLTDIIEVTVNNLAAVPSIIFGLLGLAVFLNFFGVPRSTPLAGGIVLALMTLPTVIIASRAAIRSVPPSIRDAALGLGASKVQASFHHVLPLAMPGILTGTIIGMAQALGETAPLIMIGMVAFLVEAPSGITDSATALPVQIFRWFAFPERAFEMRTAAAILILLGFLISMNAFAIWLRKRFERRW